MHVTTQVAEQDRLTVDAQTVLEIGKRHGCTFLVHPFTGTITEPKAAIGWVYVPLEQDNTPIPEEGYRRLKILRSEGVRASQVLIGHEIPVPEATNERPARRPWIKPLVVAGIVGVATLGVVAAGALAVSALAAPAAVAAPAVAPVAVPSVASLGAVGLLAGAVLVDPSLVIVCQGSEQWVQIFSWLTA